LGFTRHAPIPDRTHQQIRTADEADRDPVRQHKRSGAMTMRKNLARPTYAVVFQATTGGNDSIHSLRAVLKFAGRRGLRAVDVRERHQSTKHLARRRRSTCGSSETKQRRKEKIMDMSEFAGSRFLKVQDVKGGPIRARIVRVDLGKYNKPNIHLDDGNILSGNATNVRALCRAYGSDSEGWIDHEIELTLGTIEYQGEDQEAIIVNPIAPSLKPKAEGAAKLPKAKSKLKSEMDDEINF
jgi:hypothetical protein